MNIPDRPKIYHITHVDNLPGIVSDGGLLSDRRIIDRGGPADAIGMSKIKQRRLGLPVHCHPRGARRRLCAVQLLLAIGHAVRDPPRGP